MKTCTVEQMHGQTHKSVWSNCVQNLLVVVLQMDLWPQVTKADIVIADTRTHT